MRDILVATQPALHRGAAQDNKGTAVSAIAIAPCDFQAKSGASALTYTRRYTASGAAFTVLRGSG